MPNWQKEWIPLGECKDGYLYRLSSRNLIMGVFHKSSQSFLGMRLKFTSEFIDQELHWDVGPPHGTAKPTEEVCQVPSDVYDNYKFTKKASADARDAYAQAALDLETYLKKQENNMQDVEESSTAEEEL
jgi:hypothetical protein